MIQRIRACEVKGWKDGAIPKVSGVEHSNRELLIVCRRVGGVLDPRSCDRVRKSPLLILLIIRVFCGCVDPI